MSDKTEVWVLPFSRKLLVTQYPGPPVESCNWDEATTKRMKDVGLNGALFEFNTWSEAGKWAEDFAKKNHWSVDYSSPDGDAAARISLGDDYVDEDYEDDW